MLAGFSLASSTPAPWSGREQTARSFGTDWSPRLGEAQRQRVRLEEGLEGADRQKGLGVVAHGLLLSADTMPEKDARKPLGNNANPIGDFLFGAVLMAGFKTGFRSTTLNPFAWGNPS